MNIQNPLEQFQIVPIIPIKAGAIDISFTNSSLMMILATGAFINVCRVVLVEGQGHLVPNRWQALIEFFYVLTVMYLILILFVSNFLC